MEDIRFHTCQKVGQQSMGKVGVGILTTIALRKQYR
jgi:hypothetical protein